MRAKWRAFVDEYFRQNMNGTRAYKAVYGVEDDDVAGAAAARLLGKVRISGEIEKRLDESAMSANEVLSRLSEQARGEHSRFMTPAGPDMKALIDAGKAHLINEWHRTSDGSVKVKFYDAHAALVDIGKYRRMFAERVEHSGEVRLVKGYVDVSPDDWDEPET